jgi:acetylglutamate/LysW-gamma-L-alpha-aminoadipate kinase
VQGGLLVVKVGGRVLASNLDSVVGDVVDLWRGGLRVVLVHGGGDVVTEYSRRMGVEPRFVVSPEGVRSRYTSLEELEVYVMVMAGRLNKWIVSKIVGLGGRAVGVTGADGPTLVAERRKRIIVVDERGRRRVVEGGYTGRIVRVETGLLNRLLEENYVVVVAPVAVDSDGTLLNVDGDQAALKIAAAIKADKVILLTDVEGLVVDGGIVRELTAQEAKSILPKIGPGMNRKMIEAVEAVEGGVREILIANGLLENPVKKALENPGTRIAGNP